MATEERTWSKVATNGSRVGLNEKVSEKGGETTNGVECSTPNRNRCKKSNGGDYKQKKVTIR